MQKLYCSQSFFKFYRWGRGIHIKRAWKRIPLLIQFSKNKLTTVSLIFWVRIHSKSNIMHLPLLLKHKHKLIWLLRYTKVKSLIEFVEYITLLLTDFLFEFGTGSCTNNDFMMNLEIWIDLQYFEINSLFVIRGKHLNTLYCKIWPLRPYIFVNLYLSSSFLLKISYQRLRPPLFSTFIRLRAYRLSLLFILISIESH